MALDTGRMSPADRAAAKRLTDLDEAGFQEQVLELARLGHWIRHAERAAGSIERECRHRRKDRYGRWTEYARADCPICKGTGKRRDWATPIQGDKGFQDLVLAHPGRGLVVFAELKVKGNDLSTEQVAWKVGLEEATAGLEERVLVRVWRPEDMDAIKALLLEPRP